MDIEPVCTNATGNSTDVMASELATLAPTDILQYVRSRLSDIDGQMRGYMDEADKNRKEAKDLSDYQALLTALNENGDGYATAHHTEAGADATACAEIDAAENRMTSPDLKADLENMKSEIQNAHAIPANEIQAKLETTKGRLADINSENEMIMMKLSSLMQTRTQIIQFCSNVLASLNDGAKATIQNMRA
jgi:hypothetical protein